MSSINEGKLVHQWHARKYAQTAGRAALYILLVGLTWVYLAFCMFVAFIAYDIIRTLWITRTTDLYVGIDIDRHIGTMLNAAAILSMIFTITMFTVVLINRIFARRYNYLSWYWYPVVPLYRRNFEKLGEWVVGYKDDDTPAPEFVLTTREKYIAKRRIRMN